MRTLPTRLAGVAAASALALLAACGGGGGGGGDGNAPLAISSNAVDDGMIGVAYSKAIATSGGRGAKAFSINAGTLPAGLSMSTAGVISGTPAGPAGTASFTVSVTDSAATPATDTQAFTMHVVEPLAIATAALSDTSVGEAYGASILATGGAPPYAFSVASGELPDGVSLDAAGEISGTVAGTATTGSSTIRVQDSSTPAFSATRGYSVRVALEIASTALEDATGGIPYSDSAVVQGGLPPYAWSLTSGALPAGLAGPNPVTGEISGTPEAACSPSSASLGLAVTDSDTPPMTATRNGIQLAVNPATLEVTTTALANALIGAAYNQRVIAAGGVPPYSYAITAGSLPSQLALNASNGRIKGTPDTAETQNFAVTVTDDCANTASRALGITVTDAPLGRNDSIADATLLAGNGTYHASISPSGNPNTLFAPDEDFYRISTTAASDVTVDINARSFGSPMDSVIEILGANGLRLGTCVAPAFNSECVHDDDDTANGDLDSFLQVRLPASATFYIHVVDWGGNARPDKLYDLVISGVN